eukprot:Opistho-1_new@5901
MLASKGGLSSLRKKKNATTSKEKELFQAVNIGDSEKVMKLLTNTDINTRHKRGRTLLHMAALTEHSAVVSMLLERKGIDVNIVDDDGNTALHLAALFNRLDNAALIINHPSKDALILNNNMKTPYECAKSQDMRNLLGMYTRPEHEPVSFLPEKEPKPQRKVELPEAAQAPSPYTDSQVARRERNLKQRSRTKSAEAPSGVCAIL